uniref:Macaca fascicularis brain cDNA clone: QflA-16248, similar to human hypothetical gene supported by AK091211; AK125852(LOC401484), mRNA, RefSeq: XM_376801.1 n=1 Tax=Macaca fascicularis TaxID=9541 RepID=I7G4Y8_MACFA|nr:unnamed protein product [Macaca fascicularis]
MNRELVNEKIYLRKFSKTQHRKMKNWKQGLQTWEIENEQSCNWNSKKENRIRVKKILEKLMA